VPTTIIMYNLGIILPEYCTSSYKSAKKGGESPEALFFCFDLCYDNR